MGLNYLVYTFQHEGTSDSGNTCTACGSICWCRSLCSPCTRTRTRRQRSAGKTSATKAIYSALYTYDE